MLVLQQKPNDGGRRSLWCVIDGIVGFEDVQMVLHDHGLPLRGLVGGLSDAKLAIENLCDGLHDRAVRRDLIG